MADHLDKNKRSWNMSRIKGLNTKPEMIVRKFLHSKGFRYRIHNKKVSGKPDLSNMRKKIAIFVNGCYWHRHGCKHTTTPKTNREFWLKKFKKNTERDKNNYESLKSESWKVLIIWECEIDEANLDALFSRINE